jgi:outer membrane protein assembly factor BamB
MSESENAGDHGKNRAATRKRRRWLDYTWRTLLFGLSLLAFLMLFTGLRIEWRGGYIPALTWHKTKARQVALPDTAPFPRSKLISSNTPADWPGFRGPGRDGIVRQSIQTNWPIGGLPLLWRVPCGSGYGSFAIAEGMVFTLEQRESNEVLIAYSLENGSVIWSQHWPDLFQEYFAGEGPRSTPSYSDGKVYALGALGHLGCYQAADGIPIWSRDLLEGNRTNAPAYGVASSPLIFGNNLVVLEAGGRGASILCLDKNSGQKIWAILDDPPGYASPILVDLAGVKQIIVSLAKRTVGLDPPSGRLLWEYPWRVGSDQMPIAQPVIITGFCFPVVTLRAARW